MKRVELADAVVLYVEIGEVDGMSCAEASGSLRCDVFEAKKSGRCRCRFRVVAGVSGMTSNIEPKSRFSPLSTGN